MTDQVLMAIREKFRRPSKPRVSRLIRQRCPTLLNNSPNYLPTTARRSNFVIHTTIRSFNLTNPSVIRQTSCNMNTFDKEAANSIHSINFLRNSRLRISPTQSPQIDYKKNNYQQETRSSLQTIEDKNIKRKNTNEQIFSATNTIQQQNSNFHNKEKTSNKFSNEMIASNKTHKESNKYSTRRRKENKNFYRCSRGCILLSALIALLLAAGITAGLLSTLNKSETTTELTTSYTTANTTIINSTTLNTTLSSSTILNTTTGSNTTLQITTDTTTSTITTTTVTTTDTTTSTMTTTTLTTTDTTTSTITTTTTVTTTDTTTTTMTTTTVTTTSTTITYAPTGIYALQVPSCATWDPVGITVAGQQNGSPGSGAGSLDGPVSIFIDNNYTLYISDRDNNRIMKYLANATTGILVAGNTTAGNDSSELNTPKGVAVDQTGAILVGDSFNYRIQRFPLGSTVATTLASNNSANILGNTRDLYIDVNNVIYMTDSDYNRVVKFYPNNGIGVIIAGNNGQGSAANQLDTPFGSFMGPNQTLYIADSSNHRIQKWNAGATSGITVAGVSGSSGTGLGKLDTPQSVILDNNGFMYIVDSGNSRVVRWTSNYAAGGECIVACSLNTGTQPGRLNGPRDLKFDPSGDLYVNDQGNNRIQKFMLVLSPNCSSSG